MVCDNGGDGVVVTVPRLLTVQNAYKVAKPEIVEESYVMPGINLEDLGSSGPIGVEDVTWAIRIPHASLVDGVVDADVPQAPVLNPMMTGMHYHLNIFHSFLNKLSRNRELWQRGGSGDGVLSGERVFQ